MLKQAAVAGVFSLFVTSSLAQKQLSEDFAQGSHAFRAGDYQTALMVWKPLAAGGDANAQYALGFMFEYGRGTQPDDETAAGWYIKAAKQGSTEAQYRLGVLYDNGWGVGPDAEKAAFWYARAAEHGHAFAQHDLAFMFLEGKGVSPDKIEAYKWLRIASVSRASVMAKHLYSVSKTLSADEIRQAERLARDWLEAQE